MNVCQENSINMDSRKVMSPQLLARLFFSEANPAPQKKHDEKRTGYMVIHSTGW